jgi:hypothetical protein
MPVARVLPFTSVGAIVIVGEGGPNIFIVVADVANKVDDPLVAVRHAAGIGEAFLFAI